MREVKSTLIHIKGNYCQYDTFKSNSRKIRWAGLVARAGGRKCVYRVLVGNPEGKIPLGRPGSRLGVT